jgi:AcrR family transcriptional regulator
MVRKGQSTAAGKDTRNAIIDAALRLLGRGGTEAFSAAALAREADVSKATIFHHFASIDRIPIAAFERLWSQSLTIEAEQPTSAREYLFGLGQQLADMTKHNRDLLRAQTVFFMRAIFDRELSERLSQGAEVMHGLVVGALRSRLRQGISREEIELKARLAEMTLDGLMIGLVTYLDAERQAVAIKAWRRLVDMLLEGDE